MKKIIVPVDFSLFSENALRTAAFIAKKNDSELIVVHMLEFSEGLINETESSSKERLVFYLKLAEKKFEEFLDKEYLNNIKVSTIVKYHKVFNELNSIVTAEDADLIVMGSHGAAGVKEMLVGSNTEKVVRNSQVPVLVIKGLPILKDFKKAVFACGFSENDIIPYQKTKVLLNSLNCGLELLYVNLPGDKFKSSKEQEELFTSFLKGAEGNTDLLNEIKVVANYTIEKGIFDHANFDKADLIIMATHGRQGLQRFIDGSISEGVVNHSNLPVLTIKI